MIIIAVSYKLSCTKYMSSMCNFMVTLKLKVFDIYNSSMHKYELHLSYNTSNYKTNK